MGLGKSVVIRLAVCAAAVLASGSARAASTCELSGAPVVPVIKGLAYDQARAALLASGWKPGHVSKFSDLTGNEAVFHDRGYTELVSCAVASGAPCLFRFAGAGGTLLTVTTSGEENDLLDSKAVVVSADLGCGASRQNG